MDFENIHSGRLSWTSRMEVTLILNAERYEDLRPKLLSEPASLKRRNRMKLKHRMIID